jgi:hypothetical protein
VAERIVGDFRGQAIAVGQGDAALLREPATDVGDDQAVQITVLDVGVVQLRAELGDHREVDAVLEIGERIVSSLDRLGAYTG